MRRVTHIDEQLYLGCAEIPIVHAKSMAHSQTGLAQGTVPAPLLIMFLSSIFRFPFLLLRGLAFVQSSKSRHLRPLFQKLSGGSKLPQLACIKNSHHVKVVQSRLEFMDNGNHCAILEPLAQDTLDKLLGVRVHAGDRVSTK